MSASGRTCGPAALAWHANRTGNPEQTDIAWAAPYIRYETTAELRNSPDSDRNSNQSASIWRRCPRSAAA